MKNILPITFLIFTSVLHPHLVFTQDNDHDAVYLSLFREFTLNPDGSMDYRFIKKQKLLTYRSFHNLYGETFLVYNPAFQQLKINEVSTLMKNGKKIQGPANALNEVLPGYAANAPAYNGLREMVITHTGLERDAIISLDYQIHTIKGFYPALMGNEVLTETEAVKALTIKIRIPVGQSLNYRLLNIADPLVKTTENGFQVYTWTFTNLPAASAEESQKGNQDLYPRLIFSSFKSREEMIRFLTQQQTFGFQTDASMKNEISKLKAETSNSLDIVLKLQDKVVNDIRLYPIPWKVSGYTFRTASETWNSNGGTLAEKMILLTALLGEAGIKAEPTLIARSGILDPRESNLSLVEDFAVKVELKEEGTIYLSVGNMNVQDLMKTLAERIFIAIDKDGKSTITTSGDPEFRADFQGTMICSSDPAITGEISISVTGAANPFLGLYRDKKKLKNYLSGGISGADLKEAKITNSNPESSFQTYTVQAPKPFRKDSLMFFFNIPFLSGGIESMGIHTLSSKRETPFEIPALAEENTEFTLLLPDGMTVFTPLQKSSISNKCGTYLFELRLEKGKLMVKRSLRLKERIIQPENYADFKALMDSWNNPHHREIVFKKGN